MPRTQLFSDRPVLLVEDDRNSSALLSAYLKRDGFKAIAAYDGAEALALASKHRPLCAVLDVMLPDMDGWEVCRRLRTFSKVPILITSGLGQPEDKVKGLRLGADDYLAKPFSFEELVARIKAVLRRASSGLDDEVFAYGDLTVNAQRHEVTRGGKPIALTPSEFKILELLIASPGRVFARSELVSALYPSGGLVVGRAIDVHVRQLRKKIESDPSRPLLVLTARGVGYRFTDIPAVPVKGEM